jgi:hypothetical protein
MKPLLLLLFSVIPLNIFSQIVENNSYVCTSIADSRFEIIQSDFALRQTYLLDKYRGNVFQLVLDPSDSTNWWSKIEFDRSGFDFVVDSYSVNYQVFISGIAAKSTILVNITTGASYLLVKSRYSEKLTFESILHPYHYEWLYKLKTLPSKND